MRTQGAGIYAATNTTLENCTIADNTGTEGVYRAGGTVILSKSIVWRNPLAGAIAANYCDIQGRAAGASILNLDPLFVDPAGGDYHLQSKTGSWLGGAWTKDAGHSPCIDAGDPAADYSR